MIIDPSRIPVIMGATAVGKTQYSLDLAERFGYSVLSADSMQVYRGMDIGTAKISQEERKKVEHFLIDIIDPDHPWTLYHFIDAARTVLSTKNKIMVVGGTGLYIRALVHGFQMPTNLDDHSIREALKARAASEGILSLYQELSRRDPESSRTINPTDAFRIVRALEIMEMSGQKASQAKKRSVLDDRFQLIVLNRPREVLYKRIEDRVDKMIKMGLVDEVKQLLSKGYDPSIPALQALGYKEIISFIHGEMDWDSTVNLIKQRSRNFAKRQLTWFRSFQGAEWVDLS
jgi:tRNA dimethylallyltransferase